MLQGAGSLRGVPANCRETYSSSHLVNQGWLLPVFWEELESVTLDEQIHVTVNMAKYMLDPDWVKASWEVGYGGVQLVVNLFLSKGIIP